MTNKYVTARALTRRNNKSVQNAKEYAHDELFGNEYHKWLTEKSTQENIKKMVARRKSLFESHNPHITQKNDMMSIILEHVEKNEVKKYTAHFRSLVTGKPVETSVF